MRVPSAFILLVSLLPTGRTNTIARLFLYAYAIGSPLLLMHRDLQQWAAGYCALAIVCAVSTIVAGSTVSPSSPLAGRTALAALTGAISASLVIIASAL